MRLGSLLSGSFLSAIILTAAAPLAMAADSYKVDSAHGVAIYKIQHLGVSNAYGMFKEPTGAVVFDAADPSKSSFEFEVKTDNVITGNEKRDAHLKSPDFFNAKQFPTITFKSTAVKAAGENKFEVTGDLTLHGVTKSITLTIAKTGEADTGKMGYRTGWQTIVDLKRSDYGMNNMVGPVGDDVQLTIAFEAVKQ